MNKISRALPKPSAPDLDVCEKVVTRVSRQPMLPSWPTSTPDLPSSVGETGLSMAENGRFAGPVSATAKTTTALKRTLARLPDRVARSRALDVSRELLEALVSAATEARLNLRELIDGRREVRRSLSAASGAMRWRSAGRCCVVELAASPPPAVHEAGGRRRAWGASAGTNRTSRSLHPRQGAGEPGVAARHARSKARLRGLHAWLSHGRSGLSGRR